jgi:SET family sugar efflux transporter-like MFS transporter
MASSQSSFSAARTLLSIPLFVPVFTAIVLAILAEAMGFSYIALLAVETIGLSPFELGAFLTLSALSGMMASTIFGHLHDQKPVVWPLILSLVAKALGFGLCAILREPWMLLMDAALLLGVSSASFALLFAIARSYLDGTNDAVVSSGMAALRMGGSLSWAVGPALGAAIVAWWTIEGIYLIAGALAGAALAVVVIGGLKVIPASSKREPLDLNVLCSTAPIVLALTAFHTAMFAGSNALSILVAKQFGSSTDVGLMFSLCAALEVIVMSIFVIRPAAGSSRWLLLFGFAIFAAYFALPIVWPSLWAFYVGQLLRAVGIAIVSIVGMAYLQDLLPSRAGTAAALFGNSASAGLLFSGLATGFWAEQFGYLSLFAACGVLCLVGAAPLCFRAASFRQRAR